MSWIDCGDSGYLGKDGDMRYPSVAEWIKGSRSGVKVLASHRNPIGIHRLELV